MVPAELLGPFMVEPKAVQITAATPGRSSIRVWTATRRFVDWHPAPPPQCPPYQHWNKHYWINHNGEPHFAETAIRALLTDAGWEARWATWSGGQPTFRTAPKVGAKSGLSGAALSRFAEIRQAKTLREAELAAAGLPQKELGGGSWDVIAWKGTEVIFIDTKQIAQTWHDSIRLSQRLWLEVAVDQGMSPESFLVLEWKF